MTYRTVVEIEYDRQPGVYLILNTMSNRAYVGQAMDIGERLYTHRVQLTNGVHPNEELQRDWNDFGMFHFEFMALVTQKREPGNAFFGVLLHQLERLFMRVYQSRNPVYGYNSAIKNRKMPPVEPMFQCWMPARQEPTP